MLSFLRVKIKVPSNVNPANKVVKFEQYKIRKLIALGEHLFSNWLVQVIDLKFVSNRFSRIKEVVISPTIVFLLDLHTLKSH
jgi:hypothetical protein